MNDNSRIKEDSEKVKLPNGSNLQTMRTAANMTIKESVIAANLLANEIDENMVFSERSLRRFENIGISDRYGKTPPTLAELYILMHIYSGTPSYLMLGQKPVLYPIQHNTKRRNGFINQQMVDVMGEIASWPRVRQQQFFEFFDTFVKR
jgi:hypothetical protein